MIQPRFLFAVHLLAAALSPVWAQVQTELFIPQIITGTELTPDGAVDYRTAFRVISGAGDPLRITIQLRDNSGLPLEGFFVGGVIGGGPASEVEMALDPFGLAEVATSPGPLAAGWARIVVTDFESMDPRTAEISVEATLETELRGLSGDVSRSTSLTAAPLTQAFSAYGRITPQGATGIALLNPSKDESAEVSIQLVSVNGTLMETSALVLPPMSKISQFLDDPGLFVELATFRGTLEVRSSVPLAAAIIRSGATFWDTLGILPPRLLPSAQSLK